MQPAAAENKKIYNLKLKQVTIAKIKGIGYLLVIDIYTFSSILAI